MEQNHPQSAELLTAQINSISRMSTQTSRGERERSQTPESTSNYSDTNYRYGREWQDSDRWSGVSTTRAGLSLPTYQEKSRLTSQGYQQNSCQFSDYQHESTHVCLQGFALQNQQRDNSSISRDHLQDVEDPSTYSSASGNQDRIKLTTMGNNGDFYSQEDDRDKKGSRGRVGYTAPPQYFQKQQPQTEVQG